MDRSFSAPASQAPSRTGTPQPQNANPEISDDRALRQLTAHVHDIRRFNEALTEFFGTRIQDLIPQPSPNDTEDIPRPEGESFDLACDELCHIDNFFFCRSVPIRFGCTVERDTKNGD